MLHFEVVRDGGTEAFAFEPSAVILGGYAARAEEDRQRHIDELAEIGIPPPESAPTFVPVSRNLVTSGQHVEVQGDHTSGEVEFVLLFTGAEVLVTICSDHTDRALETYSIPRSKQVSAKVIGKKAVPLPAVVDIWDEITLKCDVREVDQDWTVYQQASLAELMTPDDLVGRCFVGEEPRPGTMLLSGTIPIIDGKTRYAPEWRGFMTIPGLPVSPNFYYSVTVLSD